jgi:hypothetical protein
MVFSITYAISNAILPRETVQKNDRDEQNARPSFKSLLTPIRLNAIQPSTQ